VSGLFIDTKAQAVQNAVQAFSEGHGIARKPDLERDLSAKMVALLKAMDLSEAQYRHIATVVLNDEKRIQSGTATAERKAELAMHSIELLKTLLGVGSTAAVLQFVHALNAYHKRDHPDINAVLKDNDERGGALGSEPAIVMPLARHYRAHLAASETASRAAQWPRRKHADAVSRDIPVGGVLSPPILNPDLVERVQDRLRRDPSAGPSSFWKS
jgi:hypothetical protein